MGIQREVRVEDRPADSSKFNLGKKHKSTNSVIHVINTLEQIYERISNYVNLEHRHFNDVRNIKTHENKYKQT